MRDHDLSGSASYDPLDEAHRPPKKQEGPSIFDAPLVVSPMSRKDDPGTSKQAAAIVLDSLGSIQRLVLEVYREHGAMTARTAERLPEFESYGFSTIRKRISELAQAGYLREAGIDRTGKAPCTIYEAA
ncbi:MAG: hypothetical protein GY856_36925 [bacterium]|nr:hypothetical protein [bacterium]